MSKWKRRMVMPALSVVIVGLAGVFASGRGSPTATPGQVAAVETRDVPVQVEIVSSDVKEGKARWKVSNVSGKDILAYCVVVRCLQVKGCQLVHTTVLGATSKPPGDLLRAGSVYEHRGGLPSGSGGLTWSVDYVLFADGSAWGPDEVKQSLFVQGFLEGRRGVYGRLGYILKTQGVQSVANEVQESQPR